VNFTGKKPQVRDVRILSTGSYTPEKVLTNADFEKMVDTSDEWIVTRTGIRERRIAADDVAASDLAEIAGRRALERARIRPEDLDGILVATVTGDHPFPSTSCLIQARLGARQAFCLDLQAACSGFIYSCEVARGLIGAGLAETLLVVAVEVLSKITDYEDRATCVLFGDAAGAAVLVPGDEEHRILASYLGADGEQASLIEMPAGGSRVPISHEAVDQRLHYLKLKGNEVFKLGVRGMAEACFQVLDRAGVTPGEIDLLVPHQANLRIIDALAKRVEIDPEKVFVNVDRYGNTSAASVPLALDEACAQGRLREGDLVMLVVFGGGLTVGATLLRW
jgi:3-oxoacyl-[acyl-carrier-protein] synthase-3